MTILLKYLDTSTCIYVLNERQDGVFLESKKCIVWENRFFSASNLGKVCKYKCRFY